MVLNKKEASLRDDELIKEALRVRENAYTPYSQFKVSAAIRTKNGRVFSGVNVENVSLGGSICAERSTICSMVNQIGYQEIVAIAVCSSIGVSMCGICRQFLSEFVKEKDDCTIIIVDSKGQIQDTDALSTYFPKRFVKF